MITLTPATGQYHVGDMVHVVQEAGAVGVGGSSLTLYLFDGIDLQFIANGGTDVSGFCDFGTIVMPDPTSPETLFVFLTEDAFTNQDQTDQFEVLPAAAAGGGARLLGGGVF